MSSVQSTITAHRVLQFIVAGAIGVLGVAGLLKLVDLGPFVDGLRAWSIFPAWSHRVIALLVPAVELSAGLAWFLASRRRTACAVAGVLYVSFGIVHAAQWNAGVHPQCNCMGVLSDAIRLHAHALLTAAWTTALGGLCLGVAWVWPPAFAGQLACRTIPHAASEPQRQADQALGFTLIETVLVVAAVGILVAASLPSLASARAAARSVKALSDLRMLAAGFHTYATDFSETWPCITSPKASHTVLRAETFVDTVPYFAATYKWHVPLAAGYFGVPWWSELFASPFVRRGADVTWYWYSAAFRASTQYWRAETRTGPEQWGATKLSDVLFTSQKALLAMVIGPDPRGEFGLADPMPMSRVDGSARAVPLARVHPGYDRGEGMWPGYVYPHALPTVHTIDGVRGRDIP